MRGNAPFSVHFEPLSTGPLDHEYTYAWNFGDDETSDEDEPVHRFATPGSYTVELVVTDETEGDSARATLVIESTPPVDFRVADVGFSPRRTRTGEEVAVTWVFGNAGADAIGEWEMAVFVSEDEAWDEGDSVLSVLRRADDVTASPRPFEQVFTLPTSLTSGDYYVGVVADAAAAIGDADRDDNVAFAPFALEIRNATDNGPDLAVCNFNVPSFDLVPVGDDLIGQLGDQMEVEICFTNTGNRSAPSSGYGIFLSRDEFFDPEDRVIGRRAGIALGSEDRQVQTDIVDLPFDAEPGVWRFIAVADPDDEVVEQLEDNNEFLYPSTFELVAPGEVEGVDLVLAGFTVEGDRAYWGQTIAGEIRLVNRGDTAVERQFVVRVMAEPVDGREAVQIASVNVSGIPARDELTLDASVSVSRRVEPGQYRLTAIADPTNGVGDVNPGNNRRTLQVLLSLGGEPDVDPTVDSVAFMPGVVDAGSSISIDYSVTNLGTDPTGQLELAFALSADATWSSDDPILDTLLLASIDGETTVTGMLDAMIPMELDQQVAAWRLLAVADPNDRLTGELDEGNNVDFAPSLLTVRGATGGCAEDLQFEPNNTAANASEITPGAYPQLGACDDADWYAVEIPALQVLDIGIIWSADDGVASLDLTDDDGEVVLSGEAPEALAGALAIFEGPWPETRRRLIRVTGGGARFQYGLTVALTDSGERANLRARSLAMSPPIAEAGAPAAVALDLINAGGTDAPRSTVGLALVNEDGDVTEVGEIDAPSVAAGETVRVDGDISIPERISDGAYRLRATLDASDEVDEVDEDDNTSFTRVRLDSDAACEADSLEPNLSPYEPGAEEPRAAPIATGRYDNLSTCDGNDDWLSIELAAGERLEVEARFDAREGDIDLELYATDGETLLDVSNGLQGEETVRLLRAPEAGNYYVRVFLRPADALNAANSYTLIVDVRAADACGNDDYEPNDNRETAQLLPDGRHDLKLCPGEEDWYRFAIPAGNTVSFQVASGAAGVTIALFGTDGLRIDERRDRITLMAEETGTYYLRARVDSVDSVDYTLTIAGVSGVDLTLDPPSLEPAIGAPGEDIRVVTSVHNRRGDGADDVLIRYTLSRDNEVSATDIVLGERRVVEIPGGETVEVRERVSLPFDVGAGRWFVIVTVDPDSEIPDLRRSNNAAATPIDLDVGCRDDDERTNEGPVTATPLIANDGEFEGGMICPHTEDWFRLVLPNEGLVEIRIEFDHDAGDLDLEVYDAESMALLGRSRREANIEVVEIEVDANNALLIRVDGFLDAQNEYALLWSVP